LTYRTRISSTGQECLARIKEKKILRGIYKALEALAKDPERQGKALHDILEGYRSIHAWRDSYRIVYQVRDDEVVMIMVGKRLPGKKDDIYAAAQKLVRNLERLQ
jgi:mRNA-degrading endonuclease RelE of RelBE toxin-antitoxin system